MTRAKDVWAGLIFAAFGAAFLLLSSGLPLGTAMHMGPAYFPVVLGSLLTLMGAVIALTACRSRAELVTRIALTPVLCIVAAILSFVLLIRPAGIIIAVVVAVGLATAASRPYDWRRSILLALALAALCALVFVRGLGMPIPLLPPAIGHGL
jgi:putative tricarboxylic transport membrane protein